MANIRGYNVGAAVVPYTTDDIYPSHFALYGNGGWREVPDYADRDTIKPQRLSVGMIVVTQSDGKKWELIDANTIPLTPANWREYTVPLHANDLIGGHHTYELHEEMVGMNPQKKAAGMLATVWGDANEALNGTYVLSDDLTAWTLLGGGGTAVFPLYSEVAAYAAPQVVKHELNGLMRLFESKVVGDPVPVPAPSGLAGDVNWRELSPSEAASAVAWANITGKPTTLGGYGITDAYTKVEADARFAPMVHFHDDRYAPVVHQHAEYSPIGHSHPEYAPVAHDHPEYALVDHTHDEFVLLTQVASSKDDLESQLATLGQVKELIGGTGMGEGYIAWSNITGKPTTIAGYGITDAFTRTLADTLYADINHNHDSLYAPILHTHEDYVLTTRVAELATEPGTQVATIDVVRALLADGGSSGGAMLEDVTVIGGSLNGMKEGMTFFIGDDLTTVIKKMAVNQKPAVYVGPTVRLDATDLPGVVEAGSVISPDLVGVFTQNDAGALNSYELKQDGVVIHSGLPVTVYEDLSQVVGDVTISYLATFGYAQGPVKNDNLGQPSPEGQVAAGSMNTSALTVRGARAAFYGTDAVANSNGIRALVGKLVDAKGGSKLTIRIPAGAKSVDFAYDASLPDPVSVWYEDGNLQVREIFVKSTVAVAGANNFQAITYKHFRYTPAAPFSAAVVYTVTI